MKTRHLVATVPLEKMRASLATATPEDKQLGQMMKDSGAQG
ncbi:hypothetical protein [Streptomyces sp. LN699]